MWKYDIGLLPCERISPCQDLHQGIGHHVYIRPGTLVDVPVYMSNAHMCTYKGLRYFITNDTISNGYYPWRFSEVDCSRYQYRRKINDVEM